ncbi:MAG TPA: tRNA pseudouridine(38-40) synthase TruA [Haliscomenobacter sp.]|uniref:tRNA pseudouridine(38-40) synthase TruA n=1 Tax=Haliscomenobacter sp. TaxID=2717303 RepID=UPI002B5A72F9|nr:tRNA pseudouridine(38-40) synthase TruA [Haliscomenobacter sp.]HOY15692.1 tRNA pseudouridine(38-40) synthase TruA [Haliscomenobacter sp.]HPH18541.1 tRNA pseudouridine(38-40) synthase TruA [Haliscomenobacter sp.]
MAKFKLTLEYDGSRFKGWQVQEDARSIQGQLIKAAKIVFETDKVEVYGSGRTDAGVHALGQVAHLAVDTKMPVKMIRQKLNDQLTHDINVLSVDPVSDKFHARHDAVARSYVYQISRRRNAFGKHFMWWVKDPLDVERMNVAAAHLIGMHDFKSFSNEKGTEKSSKVELQHLKVVEKGDKVVVHIIASHFLWKMVRRVVGSLVEVGAGRLDPEKFKEWLEKPSQEPAKFTAPPAGLFLERVYFPKEKISTEFRTLL